MKYCIREDTASAYWYENEVLMTAPLYIDGHFDTAEKYAVEADLIGDEIPNAESGLTFNQIYAEVYEALLLNK